MIIVFWQVVLEFKVELVMVIFPESCNVYVLENKKINLPDPCRLPLTENDESEPHSSSDQFVFVADQKQSPGGVL